LESEQIRQAAAIAELERRADVVRDTAEKLAKKYEEQLPGVTAEVDKAIAESQAAAILAAKAQQKSDEAKAEAEAAKTDAETATTEATTAKAEATTAKTEATEAKADAEEAVTEARGLRARIEQAKAEGAEGVREVAKAVVLSYLQPLGIGGVAALAFLAFVVWDVRQKIKTGDPLAVQKVAPRVRRIVRKIKNRGKANEEVTEEEIEE
jgi:chromosome segregation ATPase